MKKHFKKKNYKKLKLYVKNANFSMQQKILMDIFTSGEKLDFSLIEYIGLTFIKVSIKSIFTRQLILIKVCVLVIKSKNFVYRVSSEFSLLTHSIIKIHKY